MFQALGFIVIACAVSAGLGAYYSQNIKDWAKGVPATLRADLVKAENDGLAKLKAAVAKTPTVVAAPAAPAAPVAAPATPPATPPAA